MSHKEVGPEQKLKLVFVFMFFIVVGGVSGYMLLEDASLLDSLYMTVISLTTVGFKEAVELREQGKIFTIVLLFVGVGTLFYAGGLVVQMFIEGIFGDMLHRRKLERRMTRMKDHYIVAGYGRVGQTVCNQLALHGRNAVVIESNPELLDFLKQSEKNYIFGDATQDEVLLKANITEARALITTIAEEAHNVYLALSARQMNRDLFIIARADSKEAEIKLNRAGANRVICPHELGGMRMAMATIRPNLLDFMQIGTSGKDVGLSIEEVEVKPGSRVDGKALKDSGIRADLDLMVVAIRKESEDMRINPAADAVIHGGDVLIVIGKNENLARFDEYVSNKS